MNSKGFPGAAEIVMAWKADWNPIRVGMKTGGPTQPPAGSVTASHHKLVANLLNHGTRHWAQVATVLRLHGHADQWPHDLLLSDALA